MNLAQTGSFFDLSWILPRGPLIKGGVSHGHVAVGPQTVGKTLSPLVCHQQLDPVEPNRPPIWEIVRIFHITCKPLFSF